VGTDHWHRLRIAGVTLAALAVAAGLGGGEPPSGVVVEALTVDGALERAGIVAGDILVEWRREDSLGTLAPDPAHGSISSPADIDRLEVEEASRGRVRLHALRAGARFEVAVPPGRWGFQARPVLPSGVSGAYETGLRLQGAGLVAEGTARWRAAVAREIARDNAPLALWLEQAAVEAAQRSGGAPALDSSVERVQRLASSSLNRREVPGGWDWRGELAERRNDFRSAEAAHRRALELRRGVVAESLTVAATLDSLGRDAWFQGRLAVAREFNRLALALRARLAPASLDAARSVHNVGYAAMAAGDLDTARRAFAASFACFESAVPGTLETAAVLNNLGLLAGQQADLPAAQAFHERALAIRQSLAPQSAQLTESLTNLGLSAVVRGDLARAETLFRRSLAILEEVAPGGPYHGMNLNNLGIVAWRRGELAEAEDYYVRAAELFSALAPDSSWVATTFNNLGLVAQDAGRLERAAEYFERALEIHERTAPGSAQGALAHANLGRVLIESGDYAGARARLEQALAVFREQAPGGLDEAACLIAIGDLAFRQGELERAEALFRASREVHEKLAPGSLLEADTCHRLARVLERRQRLEEALSLYRRAVDALEQQRARAGGGEAGRSSLMAGNAVAYQDLVSLEVRMGLVDEAFVTLERYRAHGLLEMIAERDLDLRRDAPAELLREAELVEARHEAVRGELATLSPLHDPQRCEELAQELRRLAAVRREVEDRIRAASPRLASLRQPQPLGVTEAAAVLDPGTLLLSVALAEDRSFILALLDGRSEAHLVDLKRTAIEAAVGRFRLELTATGPSGSVARGQGSRLGHLLLDPVAGLIAKARRVLICPDGALHYLPWAALETGRGTYLVEEAPVSQVLSATLFAELRKADPPSSGENLLVAVGDPDYGDVGGGRLVRDGLPAVFRFAQLERLTASRAEVEGIAARYGDRARVLTGAAASEAAVRAIGRDVTFVHLACHGLADERFPLDSGLVLSVPEGAVEAANDGVLQAWEVFESIRLDASLVVLSACDTGLGQELGGEGLLGLTRAFQYAGARSVLASLWSVDDASTAELMGRFYGFLQAGMAKDEALREAQLSFMRSPVEIVADGARVARDDSAPFYWAAFQLIGDWK